MWAFETHYNGYRFRSRLEARWAVFFDTLGVPYEYEKEGYNLNEVQYLPDFWLSDQDCFVEIKGQEPTSEERGKTWALAFYTGKNVFTFFGDVWYDNGTKSAYVDYGVHILARFGEPFSDEYALRAIEMPRDLIVFLVRLEEAGIHLRTEDINSLEKLMEEKQVPRKLLSIARNRKQELSQYLTLDVGWEWGVDYGGEDTYQRWCECPYCHKVGIAFEGRAARLCDCEEKIRGTSYGRGHNTTSPRLLAAYTAARSARFEHGEHGGI